MCVARPVCCWKDTHFWSHMTVWKYLVRVTVAVCLPQANGGLDLRAAMQTPCFKPSFSAPHSGILCSNSQIPQFPRTSTPQLPYHPRRIRLLVNLRLVVGSPNASRRHPHTLPKSQHRRAQPHKPSQSRPHPQHYSRRYDHCSIIWLPSPPTREVLRRRHSLRS